MKKQVDIFYNVLIASLIIGLVISLFAAYWIRTNLYADEGFSELYFSDPDGLPNKVKLNTSYTYGFVIKSDEKENQTYHYQSNLQLYNIYDSTESKYRCISKYRDKIFLDWTNNTGDVSLFDTQIEHDKIQDMIVLPNYEQLIDWDNYNINFKFSKSLSNGKLIFYFANQTDMKYFVTFDIQDNRTLFNGRVAGGLPEIKRQNNGVEIIVGGGEIIVYLNDMLVLSETYLGLSNGQVGFASQDNYFGVSNLKVFRDTPIVVPDDKNRILEYSINSNFLVKQIYAAKELRKVDVPMLRSYVIWNESIDCGLEPFYCEFFDLPDDINFLLEEKNLTRIVQRIPVSGTQINYVLNPQPSRVRMVNWSDFSVSFGHDQFRKGERANLILNFGDKWAVSITRNNSYFFRPVNIGSIYNGILISEFRNPLKLNETSDDVRIDVDNDTIALFINNQSVFEKPSPVDYTNGQFDVYIKNKFVFLDSIQFENNDPVCINPDNLEFCELSLRVSSGRTFQSSDDDLSFDVEYSDYYSVPGQEETTVLEEVLLTTNASILYSSSIYSSTINLFNDASLLDLDPNADLIRENFSFPVFNPFIPDTFIMLDSRLTSINNNSDYSLSYWYKYLDGIGVMKLGLRDSLGNDRLVLVVSDRSDSVLIHHFDGTSISTFRVPFFINSSRSHSPRIEVKNETAFLYLDNRLLHTIPNFSLEKGSFFVASKNTYSELGDVRLFIDGYSRRVSINDDPCAFRTIHQEIVQGNVTLAPDQVFRATKTFIVREDFDYGLVTVTAKPMIGANENNTLEVHFWVVRDD